MLRWAGSMVTVVGLIATAGGLWTFSDLITRRIDSAIAKREKDINTFRDNVINSVADFKLKAKEALQEIASEKTQVAEQGRQARAEIALRVSAVMVGSGSPPGVITIPVVVHVVYQTERENISEAQIKSQIDVLNQDFRAKNADLSKVPDPFKVLIGDAGIEFALTTTDPFGKPTTGITRTKTTRTSFPTDDSVKFGAKGGADAWATDKYL
jgi:hypothetical protein